MLFSAAFDITFIKKILEKAMQEPDSPGKSYMLIMIVGLTFGQDVLVDEESQIFFVKIALDLVPNAD